MLTPPSPHFPDVPKNEDPPGKEPGREPRKEPEPDVREPERSLSPARFSGLHPPACVIVAPPLAALLKPPSNVGQSVS
jgi:hypothetical protein